MMMSMEAAGRLCCEEEEEEEGERSRVVVREYSEERDKEAVEEMEMKCEVGHQGEGESSTTLLTHNLGDPLSRIRHFPTRVMLVAEYGGAREIVGVIRGCVKTTLTAASPTPDHAAAALKVAYVLGLRVSPYHRRYGIGTKLVKKLEEWCKHRGATYVYMATDSQNIASIKLFTQKCNYTKFRSLSALVQPVHAHYKPIKSKIAIVRLPPPSAALTYRGMFEKAELFPKDIDAVMSNKLNLGTFVAIPKKHLRKWDPQEGMPPSYAILSVWNTTQMYKLQLQGVSNLTKACCKGTRVLDAYLPWLRLPSIPNVFSPFGFYFLFGLHMEGKGCSALMRSLCNLAHNMARDDAGCGAVVAEVAPPDPLRHCIPHWKSFSWDEDIWCIKKLDGGDNKSDSVQCDSLEPIICPTSSMVFVDPRDM